MLALARRLLGPVGLLAAALSGASLDRVVSLPAPVEEFVRALASLIAWCVSN